MFETAFLLFSSAPAHVRSRTLAKDFLERSEPDSMKTEGSRMNGQPYHDYVRAVFESNLPAAAKVIQAYLADRADNWQAWPSLTTIQKSCHLGLGTVKRCIAILTANGWLTPDPSHEGPSAKRTLSIGSDRPKSGQAQNGLGPNRASARPKKEPTPGPNRATTVLLTDLKTDLVSAPAPSTPKSTEKPRRKPKTKPKNGTAIPASVDEVIAYANTLIPSLPESECEKFWTYWTEMGWRDKHNKPVRVWKLRLVSWRDIYRERERKRRIEAGEISGVEPKYVSQEEYDRVMGIVR